MNEISSALTEHSLRDINSWFGSVFKGYKKSIRQDLHISAVNTCYELESWQTPDGTYH
ncbi:hypothetical protein MNBD_BACTEROID06-677 [hydrothermal vent metagenome]|uniref:Uncharacterized protein n=1 Tax=hydrothermal vent metagenome TaxID=652676 RepID=A0A3B0UJB1_9ZZZZ